MKYGHIWIAEHARNQYTGFMLNYYLVHVAVS